MKSYNASSSDPGTKDDQIQMVTKWYEGFTQRDSEKFCSAQTEDVVYNVGGRSPFSGCITGLESVRAGLPELFSLLESSENPERDTRWKIMCADGTRVAGLMSVNWRSSSTGLPYDQRYCQIFGFRDGKICQVWEFFDTVTVHEALLGNELNQPEPEGPQLFSF